MNNTNVFPERLKEMRLKRGMTQKELGEKVGVKQNTFTNWENGKREPNFDNLIKLADILDTSTDYLLGKTFISHHTKRIPLSEFDLSNIESLPADLYPSLSLAILAEYMNYKKGSKQIMEELIEQHDLNDKQIQILQRIISQLKSAIISDKF
ncbi:helix-turn-helix domain-containing protein [Streptococcus anginosus]